jgi:hypothetical protein
MRTSPKAAYTLTHQDCGAAAVSPFKVQFSHGDLQNSLQYWAHRASGFMPKGFEAVVTGVPITAVKQEYGLAQTGVGQ